jgi:hypothetical protein
VEGIDALLNAGEEENLPLHHMANVLAQVHWETGGGMYPVKETVFASHKNKNPTDEEVIRRLDKAFAEGKLPHVKTPYWRDGYFGRGQIQITHRQNYEKFGITNPDDALKLDVSARIAVQGMKKGLFTGKKLSDYNFPEAIYASSANNPRRIVNGPDGSDIEVAKLHLAYAEALMAGGWSNNIEVSSPQNNENIVNNHVSSVQSVPEKQYSGSQSKSLFSRIMAMLMAVFRRNLRE